MGVLVIPAVVMATALSIVTWQWRTRDGPTLAVLRLLPAALLFPVVPIVPAAVQMIRGFQEIARSGIGGVQAAAALCLGIVYPLRFGLVAFLMALVASGILHMMSTWFEDEGDSSLQDATPPAALGWKMWIVIATSLLLIPAAVVTYAAHSAASIVMTVGTASTPPANAAEISQSIAARLILSAFGGMFLIAMLLIAAAFNALMGRAPRVPRPLAVYAWLILAASGTAAAWAAVRMTADIKTFEALAR